MINLLRVLSDETRLRILRLCDGEELNVHELTHILGMAQPRVSNHLRLLKDAGLLYNRREGTWAYYRMPGGADSPLPEATTKIWTETKAWMKSGALHPGDLERRAETLRTRNAPAKKYFDAVGADWDNVSVRLLDEPMRERALLTGLPPSDKTVADIGAGTGQSFSVLAPLVGKLIAIEPSDKMRLEAQRRIGEHGWTNIEIREGSLEDLPLGDGETDAAFCNMVLHHSPRPAAAIAEAARGLKPGGKLTICDFASHSADWMRDALADFWLGFDPETLANWMQRAGLENIRTTQLGIAPIKSKKKKQNAAKIPIITVVGKKRG
jgi:ubiquinone/menaquinone biosynthesis C-methylase UbiE/DNA-binding transcriptional ArsR family regulator